MAAYDHGAPRALRLALLCGVSLLTPLAATAQTQTTTNAPGGSQTAVNAPGDTSQSGPANEVQEIVVTAQKRAENLQRVPISIQAIGTKKLSELNITQAADLVKFLPSVATQTAGPGATRYYFRGIASADNANHSGPQPTVGIYFDEQPVTTVQGTPDLHLYDIARIEALAGPQGTLYGASAEAGVLRIITNKPDPRKFEAGYDLEGNAVSKGALGYKAEAFANVPLSDRAAIRLVGWYERDAGFIDNVPGTRTYPVSGVTIATTPRKDINQVDTYGGRAALKIDLNDSWTITPSVQAQEQISGGRFGYDPKAGDLAVQVYYPERASDFFYQAAATIEGKIHDFDLVYSGSYLHRTVHSLQDYTDYSIAYDNLFGSGASITDASGKTINPSQRVTGNDHFNKQSHELRLSTPQGARIRGLIGLFYQRQQHDIEQVYNITGFDPFYSNTNRPGVIWLTEQKRVDRDYAAFGEVSADIVPDHLTLTGGARVFKYDNTLYGFFGYGQNFSSHTGESQCIAGRAPLSGAFCTNLDQRAKGDGIIPRVNLTWKFDKDHLVYGTYSRGFRPGGVNRRGGTPYTPDFLTNFEIGSKNSFFDRRLTLNATVFYESWKNFQFGFLGENGLTVIRNLVGKAEVYGVEADATVVPFRGLTVNGGLAYTDATTSNVYCGVLISGTQTPLTNCPAPLDTLLGPQALAGTRLPVTPQFKFNLTGRYAWDMRGVKMHVQGSVVHQSSSFDDLRNAERTIQGALPGYETADFSIGGEVRRITFEVFVKNAFDSRGNISRYSECATVLRDNVTGVPQRGANGAFVPICGFNTYIVPTQPQTFGIRLGQRF